MQRGVLTAFGRLRLLVAGAGRVAGSLPPSALCGVAASLASLGPGAVAPDEWDPIRREVTALADASYTGRGSAAAPS